MINCKLTFQVGTRGYYSSEHNFRDYDREFWNRDSHIDYDRTARNVVLLDERLTLDYFEREFRETLDRYNTAPSQKKNPKRQQTMEEFYNSEMHDKEKNKAGFEIILQLGDEDAYKQLIRECGGDRDKADAIYERFLRQSFDWICEKNPAYKAFGSVIHFDEAVPHLHADFLPIAEGASLKHTISNDGALKAMGYARQKQQKKCAHWAEWEDDMRCGYEEFARDALKDCGAEYNILPHELWDRSKPRLKTEEYKMLLIEERAKLAVEREINAEVVAKMTVPPRPKLYIEKPFPPLKDGATRKEQRDYAKEKAAHEEREHAKRAESQRLCEEWDEKWKPFEAVQTTTYKNQMDALENERERQRLQQRQAQLEKENRLLKDKTQQFQLRALQQQLEFEQRIAERAERSAEYQELMRTSEEYDQRVSELIYGNRKEQPDESKSTPKIRNPHKVSR